MTMFQILVLLKPDNPTGRHPRSD